MAENNTSQEELEATKNSEMQTEDTKKDKLPLIKKALIIAIISLSVIFITIISIFIFKSSDETNEIANSQIEQNIQTEQQSEATKSLNVQEEKEFKFDFNNLKPETLNEQLALLTNKNMQLTNSEEKPAEIKKEEPKNDSNKTEEVAKIEENNINKAINEENKNVASSNQDSKNETAQNVAPIQNEAVEVTKVSAQTTNQNKSSLDTPSTPIINPFLNLKTDNNDNMATSGEVENRKEDKFLKLINVAKIDGNLTKKFFDSVVAVDSGVLLCRDDENLIELYYGPFLDDEARDMLFRKLRSSGFKEAYTLELSKDEFNKRCNY